MSEDSKAAEDIFTSVEADLDKPGLAKAGPDQNSLEWNDYVLSFFDDSELIDGKPLVAGLRRVAEMLLGRIIISGPTQVFPASNIDHMGRATVVFSVQFENGMCYSEVADCWIGNTDDFVAVFPVATASTRAEARALRKALKLKTVSADEITSKDTAKISKDAARAQSSSKSTTEFSQEGHTQLCSEKQENFIDNLCDRAKVDKEKLVKKEKAAKNITSKGISKKLASELIPLLNSYANDQEVEVPEDIKISEDV